MNRQKTTHQFYWNIQTSKGSVKVYAEAIVDRQTLHLRDVSIYPEGQFKKGLHAEIHNARTEFVNRAREQGFSRLEISATRVEGSTSANPNREIMESYDLTRGGSISVKPFVPHSDVLLREGQDYGRVKALEQPYKTKAALAIDEQSKNHQQGLELKRMQSLENAYSSRDEKSVQPAKIKEKKKGKDYE